MGANSAIEGCLVLQKTNVLTYRMEMHRSSIPMPDCGVPPALVRAARERVANNVRWSQSTDPAIRLRGRIHCPCGYAMTSIVSGSETRPKSGQRRRYYVCSQHRKRGRCEHVRFHRLLETEESREVRPVARRGPGRTARKGRGAGRAGTSGLAVHGPGGAAHPPAPGQAGDRRGRLLRPGRRGPHVARATSGEAGRHLRIALRARTEARRARGQ